MTKDTNELHAFNLKSEIAVIGMSCRFPGANHIMEFWNNLVNCKDTLYTFSDDELIQAGVLKELVTNPQYIKKRGILSDIEFFDADFFKMTPIQASMMDPQHRLFLEVCLEALNQAGYQDRNKALFAGVFASMSDSTYLSNVLLKNNHFLQIHDPFQTHIATSGHFLATKVSYYLNLTGPSINIQTACSSSLVSVIKACQALEAHECDVALAGGVTVRTPQTKGYFYQEGSILSKDGVCRAFDKYSTGTVSSNGLGVVVLKRLEEAIRDQDTIDATIISYGLNNDGSAKSGYAAPGVQGQAACITAALQRVEPTSISYVEAHGTGTLLGDPIEIAALTQAFRRFTHKKQFCAIGSVKTNIGHTDTAAGIAGLIKTILALKHQVIPASLHFSEGNPYIDFDSSPFYVQKESTAWEASSERRAGVSSFGIGGTNAHVILQEAPKSKSNTRDSYVPAIQFPHKQKYWLNPDANQVNPNQTTQSSYLYSPYWEPSALGENTALSSKKSWFIFANDTPAVKAFIQQLKTTNQDIICVYQGDKFHKNQDKYTLNEVNKVEYNQLFQSLPTKTFDYVVHFWSLHKNSTSHTQWISLIYFCQIFMKHLKNKMYITVITNQAQRVLPDDLINPEISMGIAFCLTIPMEYENIKCKFIDIDWNYLSYPSLVEHLIHESTNSSTDRVIAYRKDIRFLKKYRDLLITKDSNNLLKKNGIYLIIGASGKIGVHLAYYLANQFSAHLILIVRKKTKGNFSQLPPHSSLWENVKKEASSIEVIDADLNDDLQISKAIDKIKISFQRIDGIFHLAAATSASDVKTLIPDISLNQIHHQIAPKMNGVKIATQLSKAVPTGFCCLFSSISSILGAIGLTSYVAGNIYLDSIAEIHKNDPNSHWFSINLDAVRINSLKNPTDSQKLDMEQVLPFINQLSKENREAQSVIISASPLKERLNRSIREGSLSLTHLHETQAGTSFSTDEAIENIFKLCLGLKNIDHSSSFYDLGGDSLDAIQLIELLEKKLNARLTMNELTLYPSIEKIALFLKNKNSEEKLQHLLKLNQFIENKPILFLIHPIGGATFCYFRLANFLTGKVNCYGVQDISLNTMNFQYNSIEEMAEDYLNHILEIKPNADFYLGGFSFGSSLAFEMTRLLKEQGKQVKPVIIIDGWAAFSDELANYQKFRDGMKLALEEVKNNLPNELTNEAKFVDLAWARAKLLLQYHPAKTDIPIILFKAAQLLPEYLSVDDPTNYWKFYTKKIINIYSINGNHNDILRSDCVKHIAEAIEQLTHKQPSKKKKQ